MWIFIRKIKSGWGNGGALLQGSALPPILHHDAAPLHHAARTFTPQLFLPSRSFNKL
ncbi:hypothetical protein [Beijerinckia mobilis]|uniref:hypothetical protein n=1 Tax=Beijerinckia mobilis TaxID=231434 RepID=UPI0012EC93DB|nr:hypothetical protein [Beijerinckia mobilis]